MTNRPRSANQQTHAEKGSQDKRPYIVSGAKPFESPAEAVPATIGMVALALATGFVIGLGVYAVMKGSTWLTALLWNRIGGTIGVAWFPLATCTVGGLLIGLWTWWTGERVQPLEEVMAEFKATGSHRTHGAVKPVITFLLPLVFGGSIGFEAGITGLVTAGCCWIRDRLKAAGLRWAAVADVTIAASFAAIFGTPLAGIIAGAESSPHNDDGPLEEPDAGVRGSQPTSKEASAEDNVASGKQNAKSQNARSDLRKTNPECTAPSVPSDRENSLQPERQEASANGANESALYLDSYDMRRSVKIVLYTAAAFGAFGGIALFSWVFGTSGGLPRFGEIAATRQDLLWALPCLVAAYVMALVYHGSSHLFSGVSERLGNQKRGTIVKPVIAGALMGAVAMALPYVLFPGEVQSEELMASWASWSVLALLATGLLKAAITPMCLKMGWVGGNFFPSIFAGVAAGYGLSALTGADPMLMVTITTTAFLAGVTRKPLLVLGILFLCFPAGGLLWMGLAAVIGAALPIPRALMQR